MPGQTLTLFGQPTFMTAAGVVEIRSRKGWALLAYLAVDGRSPPRDTLATLLWPEMNDTRARTNLRRTLYKLNQTPIGAWLQTDAETVSLQPDGDGRIDVRQFAELFENGQLAEACALYQAEFLANFYVADSNPFERWATQQRERYRRQVLDSLHQLTEQQLQAKDYDAAIEQAHRQLEIDNLRESGHRQLMLALARQGQRTAALAQYHICRQLLRDELAVEPSQATVELFEQIEAEQIPASPASLPTAVEENRQLLANKANPTTRPNPQPNHASPYRGLFAFREEDAPFFFGREEFTEQLVTAVYQQAILPVIGPSGSGKSSVVYAGLVAELRQAENWLIASFRPSSQPFYALAATLIPYLEDNLSETDRLVEVQKLATAVRQNDIQLINIIERIVDKHRVGRFLLIADQFEELYTLCPDPALRHHFLDYLLDLVFSQQYRRQPKFTLVLTLRADFLGQVLAHRPTADAIQEADVKLGPMTQPELHRTIVKPAQKQGAAFETGLEARILADVGDEPGNLPLLEFALTILWEQQENGRLTHAAYEAIGRVAGALARYAEDVFNKLTAEEQVAARRVFIQMVRPGDGTEDTRRLATRAEMGEASWPLLTRLADARLVVTGRDPVGRETAELVHEALIGAWQRLHDWMKADREFRLWQERLRVTIRAWRAAEQDEGALLRGVALATAENWLTERPSDLSDAELSFIQTSVALRQQRQADEERQRSERERILVERERLRRRVSWLLGVGLVIAIGLAFIALGQWRSASRDRDVAQLAVARQLAAQAVNLADEQLDLALLLAVEGVRMADTPETQQALRFVQFYSPRLLQFVPSPLGDVNLVRRGISADGRLVAIGTDTNITVWDIATGESLGFQVDMAILPEAVGSLIGVSHDGRTLALATTTALYVVDAATNRVQFGPLPLANSNAMPLNFIQFSPDGRFLITAGPASSIFDAHTGERIGGPSLPLGSAIPILFSPDGAHFFVAIDDVLFKWEAATGNSVAKTIGVASAVTAAAFSVTEQRVVTGHEDGSIHWWHGDDLTQADDPWPTQEVAVTALAFSPDGQLLISGDAAGDLAIWSLEGNELIERPARVHQQPIVSFLFSDDGLSLTSIGFQNLANFAVWRWQLGQPQMRLLSGAIPDVVDVQFGVDDDTIMAVTEEGAIARWAFTTGQIEQTLQLAEREPHYDGGWRLSPDGQQLLMPTVRDDGQQTLVWDAATGESLGFQLTGPTLPIAHYAFTPDGNFLAAGGCAEGSIISLECTQGGVWLWDRQTGALVGDPLLAYENAIVGIALSADGQTVAALGLSGQVKVWEWAGQTERASLPLSPRSGLPPAVAALNPDGSLLAVGDLNELRLWEIKGEEPLALAVPVRDDNFSSLIFSTDGRLLASGTGDGDVAVWEVESGKLLLNSMGQHQGNVVVAFSGDGRTLASIGSEDGQLAIWDLTQVGLVEEEETAVAHACRLANRNLTMAEWQQYFGDEPYRQTCPDE